ncbi:MAG: phosphatidylserine decarboxylase [Lachnospiraceae bacterium]|nr:phosphatidylserine decarboxylase [Lachnospiraceae bacterium]
MERDGSNAAMRFLYGNPVGRAMIKVMLAVKAPKVMAWYLRTPFSKGMIRRYIRKYDISMKGYPRVGYRSFSDFFERRKIRNSFDAEQNHFISPCDGHLSAYTISPDSIFAIKGSNYRVSDLVDDETLAESFSGGQALVFRLAPNDYHHYCFIDDGIVHKHHFREGQLHSVQPIALANVPVFRVNRRVWTLLSTENFGPAVQIEVGALAVGGIVNERENEPVKKGETMGHFSLMGSTIVLFIEKDRMELLPKLTAALSGGVEVPVKMGQWIGKKPAEI